MSWQPTEIHFQIGGLQTAAETVLVRTDAGDGYLKALGNRGGPHRLASDLLGTYLAAEIGLPTFEFAVMPIRSENEVRFQGGDLAQEGPAFITRMDPGMTWGGDAATLLKLVNPQDISKLVLFDTWVRNEDRYPTNIATRRENLGNVFLSSEGLPDGKWRLLAMDHTHCFNGSGFLDGKLAKIDFVKDEGIYGLFPAFAPFLFSHWTDLEASVALIKRVSTPKIEEMISKIPKEWQVEKSAREALAKQVKGRAEFLSENFLRLLTAKLLCIRD